MRKLREILRLGLSCKLSIRNIAKSVSASRASVSAYLEQAGKKELTFEKVSALGEEELEKLLSLGEIGRPKQSRALLMSDNYISRSTTIRIPDLSLL